MYKITMCILLNHNPPRPAAGRVWLSKITMCILLNHTPPLHPAIGRVWLSNITMCILLNHTPHSTYNTPPFYRVSPQCQHVLTTLAWETHFSYWPQELVEGEVGIREKKSVGRLGVWFSKMHIVILLNHTSLWRGGAGYDSVRCTWLFYLIIPSLRRGPGRGGGMIQ